MEDSQHTEFESLNFFEMTPDLVCIADKKGYFKRVNDAVIATLGYTKEELFSRPVSSFIYHEDRDLTSKRRNLLLNGDKLVNFENRYLTKDGNIVWLAWTSIYFPDKEIVFGIAKDVTQRKVLESEIQKSYQKFEGLVKHFKRSLEQDRKYLATELHEELAQLASVVKMDIDWISANTPNLPEASKSRIEHALMISDILIKSMRKISYSLSPTMLDDMGLNAALEWHCKEFSMLNGISCTFKASYQEADLPHEVKIDFFRISQEALTNIMYHAEANHVTLLSRRSKTKYIFQFMTMGRDLHPVKKDKQVASPA